jgi:hypothetical protein
VKSVAAAPALAIAAAIFVTLIGDHRHARADGSTPLGETALFGIYAPGLPYSDAALVKLESKSKLGARVDIVSGFIDWKYVPGEARDRKLARGGRRLLYSWEPHPDEQGRCIDYADIGAGRADAYLERVAASMRRFPSEIYVRPWAEMNAYWSPYQPDSGRPCAGTLAEFKQAWRYLYDFFRQRGVRNLRFVFNPDVSDDPRNVPITALWPGGDAAGDHSYVDVLGLDGYNWGDSGDPGGKSWLEFEEIFRDAYRIVTQLDPRLPLWICEFGAKEPLEDDGTATSKAPVDPAHDKAHWVANMLASTAFPRIAALAYYSSYTPDYDNERDFRVDSSPESLAVFREYLQSHHRRRPQAAARSAPAKDEERSSHARNRKPHGVARLHGT